MINFYVKNLIPTSNLTASSVNSQYPLSNINDQRRTRVYRSTSNSDNIVIDLGDRSDVDSFGIVDNWADGYGITDLALEGNNVNDWVSPPFSQSITLNEKFGVSFSEFTSVEYRFFRLVMTSTLGYCEISNIFLGQKTSFTNIGPSVNWSYKQVDLVDKSRNRYNQEFFDDRGTQKQMNGLSFEIMDKDDVDNIYEVYDIARTVKPIFLRFENGSPTVVNDEQRYSGFFRMRNEPDVTATGAGFYSVTMNFTEVK